MIPRDEAGADVPGGVVLETRGLSVEFDLPSGKLRAVDDVSLEVRRGDVYALVGESGCGKSTLASALLNLVPDPGRITAGDVVLQGRSLLKMSSEELRKTRAREAATVFQAAMSSFNPVVTIGRQVGHVLDCHPEVWANRNEGLAYFEHLLELVRLPVNRVKGAFESQLSGGMKQRVAIAFACVLRPSVLILDEPTTALDVINQRLVIDVLQDLRDKLDVTIIFVTHDLSVVAELATTVGVMYAGRMAQIARIDEIFSGVRRHPYVEALLSSVPNVLVAGRNAKTIPGAVPRLDRPPPGCRFAPRCQLAERVCELEDPALIDDGVGNRVACHPLNRAASLRQDSCSDSGRRSLSEAGEPRFRGGVVPPSGGAVAKRSNQEVEPGSYRDGPIRGRSLVELSGVSHWFRNQAIPAVDGVDLSVGEGEIVAIVGESGCGKSTLGRIVCGMVQPAEGEVRFRGQPLGRMHRHEKGLFRRQVQMVHQDPFASLNPGLQLRTTLGYGVRHHKIVDRRDLDAFLLDLLHRVGLDSSKEFLGRYPHQLSGGQRQRVAIARAFSLNPSLIVADEAVSMLDVSMRVSLLDLMLGFHDDHGMAFVFVSHDLGVVRYFAGEGRMVVMFYGVVVEEGPTEDVITTPSHPYTSSLLESLPVPDPKRARQRREDKVLAQFKTGGDVSRMSDAADTGCVFRFRCPLAQERCAEAPPLMNVDATHRSACWFHEDVAALSASILGGEETSGTPLNGGNAYAWRGPRGLATAGEQIPDPTSRDVAEGA